MDGRAGVEAAASSRSRLARFGPFELDVRSGELRKAGVRVPLQEQPLKLLERLLDQPGEVVTRDELRGCLWPDDTFVDFEQGVNAAVKRLREALADSAETPRFIQTLPRRGYRFIAPVTRDDGLPAAGIASSATSASPASAAPRAAFADATADTDLPRQRASGAARQHRGDPLVGWERWAVAVRILPAASSADVIAGSDNARSLQRDSVAATEHRGDLRSAWRRRTVAVGIAALIATAAWILVARSRSGEAASSASLPAPRVIPLTSLDGSEERPTFSPDGSQVAFTWDGGTPDNADIYVTLVGSGEVRRLTSHAARDFAPAWSPDGRQIAYVRVASFASQHIRVMSALGGSDREVSDFAVWAPIAWSPDGRFIAAGRAAAGEASEVGQSYAIHLIPLGAGSPRPLTRPARETNDYSPAFSPDGRRLAYVSCSDLVYRSVCHVQVVDLDAALVPTGPPRRLTPDSAWSIQGVAWTRDGKDVIYSASKASLVGLWRADAAGARPPERVEMAGPGVLYPAIAAAGGRLAYAQMAEDADIYRLDPPGPGRPLSRSSTRDSLPNFSPDGRRIAFCSARAPDAFEVWVSDLDGSAAERLTHGPGEWQCSPSWSPDGTTIAFDSRAPDGSWHVWTIAVAGGPPRQITAQGGNQIRPSWSRDGRWIYFLWRRDGERDVWRVPVSGGARAEGPPVRITHGGTSVRAAAESFDGSGIWYKRAQGDGPLFFQPLSGGDARPVIPCVKGTHYAIGSGGIYYTPCAWTGEAPHDAPVRLFNAATGDERPFGTLDDIVWPAAGRPSGGYVISPDGRTLLYNRLHTRESDLMMIEHFR